MTVFQRIATLGPAVLLALSSAVVLVAIGTTACQPDESTLRGGEGEFCNGPDDDCATDLVCRDYVCVFDEDAVDAYAECTAICDRLDECDAGLDRCPGKCLNTTEGWGESAAEHFKNCFVEDLSCEELQESDNPPQTCYDRIPLNEQREQTCQRFVQDALDCDAAEEAISDLDRSCRAAARTFGEGDWSDIHGCSEYSGDCGELFDCLNDNVDLEHEL